MNDLQKYILTSGQREPDVLMECADQGLISDNATSAAEVWSGDAKRAALILELNESWPKETLNPSTALLIV